MIEHYTKWYKTIQNDTVQNITTQFDINQHNLTHPSRSRMHVLRTIYYSYISVTVDLLQVTSRYVKIRILSVPCSTAAFLLYHWGVCSSLLSFLDALLLFISISILFSHTLCLSHSFFLYLSLYSSLVQLSLTLYLSLPLSLYHYRSISPSLLLPLPLSLSLSLLYLLFSL